MNHARVVIALVLALSIAACGEGKTAMPATPMPTAPIVATPAAPMTHPVAGREDCRSCHLKGSDRIKKMPDDHSPYANEACRLCHREP